MPSDPLPADVVVLGGGPGGYVASIRAAQLGLQTVCVEMDRTLGGTCVNVGCVPSKALLTSSEHYEFAVQGAREHGIDFERVTVDLPRMMKRKDEVVGQNTRGIEYLFRKNKVVWARGRGALLPDRVVDVTAEDGEVTRYQARHVIIATGSQAVSLPFLPFDERRVVSNVGALAFDGVPNHLLVIGGGVIGLELGSVWRRLGARVTIVELLPTILAGLDDDLVRESQRIFRRQGLELQTSTRVVGAEMSGERVIVHVEHDDAERTIEADRVLVAVGRRPSLTGVDAGALGLELGSHGEIVVDNQMRTNLSGVFAIGDVVGGKLLAHKAEEEGIVAAEVIAGKPSRMDHGSIPNVVYTWPEIATVGLTDREARDAGHAVSVGRFPFSANSRARTLGESSGFVKFVSDAATDQLLGCHMIGPNVSELIAEAVLAFEYRGSSEDIGITVHAHPTLSEATREAALGVLGRTLHM